mgnify:CR=1 FL=1
MALTTRVLTASVAVTLALTAAACSDDDNSENGGSDNGGSANGTDLTFEEWQAASTAVCEEYEPRVEELGASLPEPTSLAEFTEWVDAQTELNDEYLDAVRAVGVPVERSDEVAQLYQDLTAAQGLLGEVRDAAAAEDEEAFLALSEDVEQRNDDLSQAAVELGVPACE